MTQVTGQAQFGMGLRKRATHETLRPHVLQKPRQAGMQFAQTICLFDPEAPARQRHHAAKSRGLSLSVHPHQRNLAAHPVDVSRQQVFL